MPADVPSVPSVPHSAENHAAAAQPVPDGLEVEFDDGSGIPRAVRVDLPKATVVDSRYAMYSLRELPVVAAEEIQEI